MEFLNHVTVLAGLAVMVVQQIVKFKAFPSDFANTHPVPALIVLSAIASAITVWASDKVHPNTWTDWLLLGVTIALTAAFTYNMTFKNWTQLREMEGEGK